MYNNVSLRIIMSDKYPDVTPIAYLPIKNPTLVQLFASKISTSTPYEDPFTPSVSVNVASTLR